MTDTRIAYRTCPLCEAGCGLEITMRGDEVVRIRGDQADVASHGYICPKGSTLKQLHEDPDRLRSPMVKRDGRHEPVSWDEAWAVVADLLTGVIDRTGRDSVAVYLGNPTAHNLGAMLHGRTLIQGIGTRNRFSASSVDQVPKQVACGWMFGTPQSVPVPDLDRTDHLVILGADPYSSNGSLCTAPDFPGRIERIRERGGKVVVVDPRRSRTAEEADEWIAIRPGADAHLMAAMAHVLVRDGLADPGDHVRPWLAGWDEVCAALGSHRFDPESVAHRIGIDSATIERLAHELADAPTAAVYGRIGTCTQEFGTTASWLVDVLNVMTGNLDRAGGAMFPKPAVGNATTRGTGGTGPGFATGRVTSRAKGLPEALGEFPVATLPDEIETPGEGQVRALVTVAGNPVLSCPDSVRMDRALASLEAMISVDIYLNETTRHADVILPPPSTLARSHYDIALSGFQVGNWANYSPPVVEREPGAPDEWEILAKLALIAQGQGPDADPAAIDDLVVSSMLRSAVKDPSSSVHDRDPDELLAELDRSGRRGPDRQLDAMLRLGPYGDGFGADPDGLSLDVLIEHPHGVDLGPLEPRLPQVLRTPSGRIELAPPALVADLDRVAATAADVRDGLVLVGRRHLRSNNSWMHNVSVLVKGKPRCTLQVHPDDAARLGLADGGPARISSRVGSVVAPVEVTERIRPGVVSLPHGWGHDVDGTQLGVAREHAGVNTNVLADLESMDPLSGNAVLNGIPVEVVAAV